MMMHNILRSIFIVGLFRFVASQALAQRGLGDGQGVARKGGAQTVEEMSGEILELVKEPCGMTTGCSDVGYHLLVKTDVNPKLNLHLGPYTDVHKLLPELAVGKTIAFQGFRTKKLAPEALIAKSITLDNKTVELRDDTLRPFWAGKNR